MNPPEPIRDPQGLAPRGSDDPAAATAAQAAGHGASTVAATASAPDKAGTAAPAPASQAAGGATREPVSGGRRSRSGVWLALLAIVIAIGGAVASWQFARRDTMTLARRLQDTSAQAQAQESQLKQALDRTRDLADRLAAAESRLAEAASQQSQLEKLYRAMSAESADSVLADAEGSLSLAAQQLASGGSTQGALLALQAVEMRMARLDDAALAGVRRAIARDAERLRGGSGADVGAIAGRLDLLAASVDSLPLIAAVGAAGQVSAQGSAADASRAGEEARIGWLPSWWPAWARFDAMSREFASLFRVRRIEGAEPLLLAPDQEYFLRENLRLLLLNARLSLLSRNDPLFRRDLATASGWLQRYFDRTARPVQDAVAQLVELSAARATDTAPSITESLSAIRAARAARESTR